MKTRRIRRTPEQAKAEIVAAAQAALDDMDYAALTVEEVTRRTGMTRSAFYHYFSSLDELTLEMLVRFEAEIRTAVDPFLEGKVDEREDYRATMLEHLTHMFEVFHTHHKSVGTVAQAASGSRSVFKQWQERILDYYIDKTAEFIRRQIMLGRSTVKDPYRIANALILMNNAVGMDNMTRANPDDPEQTAGIITDIWNAAIYGEG